MLREKSMIRTDVVVIGGVGSTLPLAFLLLRSRATHLRTIGKMLALQGT